MSEPPHISGQRGHCIHKPTQKGCGLSLTVWGLTTELLQVTTLQIPGIEERLMQKLPETGHMLLASGSFCVTGVWLVHRIVLGKGSGFPYGIIISCVRFLLLL